MWRGKDCESVDPSQPIRQADILRRFVNGSEDSLWLVITADCDIVQSRTLDSGLACVELRPLGEYLLGEHLDKVVTRQAEARYREFRDWLQTRWERKSGAGRPLSDHAIRDWVSVATPSEVAEALDICDVTDFQQVERTLSVLKDAFAPGADSANSVAKLRILARLQRKAPSDWRQFVHSQLAKLQSNQLPEDIFFISKIPGERHLGYLVKLRHIFFVRWASVAATVPDARYRADAYTRIARLTPTFKHGLAQQAGFLFARIGYPAEYEAERNEIFDLVTDELSARLRDGDD